MLTAADLLQEKTHDVVTVTSDVTLLHALEVMNRHRIGSILVKDGEQLVGIWTERDLVHNAILPGFNPATAIMRDYMIRTLVFTPDTDSVYELADKILGRRHRRLLIEHDGKFVGLLTEGDVMRAFMRVKQREMEALNSMVGWEYYEEWRWTKESGKSERSAKPAASSPHVAGSGTAT